MGNASAFFYYGIVLQLITLFTEIFSKRVISSNTPTLLINMNEGNTPLSIEGREGQILKFWSAKAACSS